MTNKGVVIQARMGASRLPGKVLKEVRGKALLKIQIERLKDSLNCPVIVASTVESQDDSIEELAKQMAIPCFRGDELDVLGRFYHCARMYQLDTIVRVTGDCPLIDGGLINTSVAEYDRLHNDMVYLSNCIQRTYPRGFDFEIFSKNMLQEAFVNSNEKWEREHVTPYFYKNNKGSFDIRHVKHFEDKSEYRLTIDTSNDFMLIRLLIEKFNADKLNFEQIIQVMDDHPELSEINKHIEQKKL